MRHVHVTLSDGESCQVRVLGLFELEKVAPDKRDPGPFFYTIRLHGGREVEAPYNLADLDSPPKKPDIPREDVRMGQPEYDQWIEYDIYRGALRHQERRIQLAEERLREIATYIMENCLGAGDAYRIVTDEDWQKVHKAALVPEVSRDDLELALSGTFHAEYNGVPLLDAMENVKGSGVSYAAIRAWEVELMVALKMTEAEYASLSVEERARKIVAMKLPQWSEILAAHEARKKR